MNYRLKIQYDGTRYKGWQRQSDKNAATIQGKIEQVLSKYAGRDITIDGAGRTDAGVHALGQVANVHLPEHGSAEPPEGGSVALPEQIKAYLNAYLPEDIRILQVEKAGERFHSRLHATGKRYSYHLIKYDRESVFHRKYAWKMTEALDLERMREASRHFVGEHDFKSFCSKASKKKSTVRRITDIRVRETEDEIILTYEGNGFLYNMVRILTGTLVEVGTGKRDGDEIPAILMQEERRFAGETAPAKGLFLDAVFYD